MLNTKLLTNYGKNIACEYFGNAACEAHESSRLHKQRLQPRLLQNPKKDLNKFSYFKSGIALIIYFKEIKKK